MRLTTNELRLFRNTLLAKQALRDTELPFGARVWEDWMQGTLNKLTDELYPQEFDQI